MNLMHYLHQKLVLKVKTIQMELHLSILPWFVRSRKSFKCSLPTFQFSHTFKDKEMHSITEYKKINYTHMREKEKRKGTETDTDKDRDKETDESCICQKYFCLFSNFQRFWKLLNDIYILNRTFIRILSIFWICLVPKHIQSQKFSL